MAIGDDFSVTVGGDIRHVSGTSTYTVLELHRWLQDLADNASVTSSSNDVVDITSLTPSERSTDEIITLLNGYNIDDTAAEYLYGGSIRQGSGATEELYSGLRVLGSVISSTTQIQIVQDGALYDGDAPFWGDQSSGGLNGDAVGGVLMRVLVKSRVNGADIDEGNVRVQVKNFGDSYAFFNVALGQGEAVAAVSSVDDPQNDTLLATVGAYTHVTNTEGFQTIDIGDGSGPQPYYSQWSYTTDDEGDGLKSVWEWGKYITRTGTASTIHGLDGELFLGPTHTYSYDNLSGDFAEDETVVWGTGITYDNLAGGTFTVGNYVRIGSSGAAGRIMYDSGTTQMIVALEDTSITLVDGDTITEYNKTTGATGVTADINVTITDNNRKGGSGILLADDESGTKHHIQLITGLAPVDNLPVRGLTSGATADVNGSVTTRTVNPVFLGSYVGTMIGGFGVGFASSDLTASDTVVDLDGDTNTPPNNVTFTLAGVVSGEDYVLVGPKAGGNDFNFSQMTLSTTLDAPGTTSVVVGSIPANTPASGTLRITLDDGRHYKVAYTSYTGNTFTIPSTDFSNPDDATSGNGVMVAYIDKLADASSVAYTTIYTSGPQSLWLRVRDGGTVGGTPIKTYEAPATLSATGGSATASRISDA